MSWGKIYPSFYLIEELEAKWYCEWEKTPNGCSWSEQALKHKEVDFLDGIVWRFKYLHWFRICAWFFRVFGYRGGKKLGISGQWKKLGNFGATKKTGECVDTATMKQRYLQGTERN